MKFSLPIGWGSTPALRWFDTTQPIAASVASSRETSIWRPLPVARCSTKAAVIAKAAVSPAIVSAIGKPVRRGAV